MGETWVVVADRARARFLLKQGPKNPLLEFEDLIAPRGRGLREGADSDRSRLQSDGSGASVHRFQPRTDPVEKEGAGFAARVAARIEKAADAGEVGQLILVAPPRFLGQLRAALPTRIRALVTRELDKELTKSTPATIQDALKPHY